MRAICLLLGWSLLLFVPAHAGHSPPKIFLRIYVQTTGEGLPDTQATRVTLPPNGDTIQIRAMPELTEHNLIAVQTDAAGSVHLIFDHQGQVVLSAFTAENQNRIMVMMIDGYIVYAPLIDEQITTGELVVPRKLGPDVLKLLQETAQKNIQEHSRT